MGVIYKITNLINDKIYIGQTWATEPQRWQSHVWHAYNDPDNDSIILCRAIKKYGKENFRREIIDESDSVYELNQKEIYYIKKFNTTNPNIGYNIALGGEGHTKIDSQQLLDLYIKYQSIHKVADILGMSRSGISKRLNGMGIITQNYTVLQYDNMGNLLNTYESFAEASRQLPILQLPKLIPPHKFASGYFWLREKDNDDIQKVILNYKKCTSIAKEIQQYNQLGEYMASYHSAAEASRILHIDVNSIKAALRGTQNSAGGYIWFKPMGQISFDTIYNNFLMSQSCCEIEEITENGQVLGQYRSACALEKKLNWSYNSIKLVCDGKKTHTHGRIFRYANPNKRQLIQDSLNKNK